MLAQLKLYWHTLRYLKPVQIYGRLGKKLARPRPDLSAPPPVRREAGRIAAPVRRPQSLFSLNRFCFLNQTFQGKKQIKGVDMAMMPKYSL
jgi:hypothetical protein